MTTNELIGVAYCSEDIVWYQSPSATPPALGRQSHEL